MTATEIQTSTAILAEVRRIKKLSATTRKRDAAKVRVAKGLNDRTRRLLVYCIEYPEIVERVFMKRISEAQNQTAA